MMRPRRNLFTSALLFGALAVAVPEFASASVVFSNFGAGQSYDIDDGNSIGNAFDGNNYAEGDTFTPTANAHLSSIEVALSCAFGCPVADNFTISLTADAAGVPGAVIESFNFPATTLGASGNNNVPITATSVLDPLLTAGTAYWITVKSTVAYSISWNWNTISDPAIESLSSDGGATWFAPSYLTPGAFQVNGTPIVVTPEPQAWLLTSGGILSLLCCGPRFRMPRLRRVA